LAVCGRGHVILRKLLSGVTDLPFAQLMHDAILLPSGLTHSTSLRAPTKRMLSHRYRRNCAEACRKSGENWHGYERNDELFSCDYKAFVDGP